MTVRPTDLASTLLERARANARRDEERRRAVLAAVETVGRELVAAGTARGVWVIGSVAHGGFGERSDADVVVSGVAPGSTDAVRERFAAACPVPVDVLELELLPESFRARVLASGREVR